MFASAFKSSFCLTILFFVLTISNFEVGADPLPRPADVSKPGDSTKPVVPPGKPVKPPGKPTEKPTVKPTEKPTGKPKPGKTTKKPTEKPTTKPTTAKPTKPH